MPCMRDKNSSIAAFVRGSRAYGSEGPKKGGDHVADISCGGRDCRATGAIGSNSLNNVRLLETRSALMTKPGETV
jgi:hypothetical protein